MNSEKIKRPLRVLHVGNIAQNGYLNAKFQRKYGIEADLLVYDYGHAPGYPEWEDAQIENYQDIQEFNPIWEDQLKFLRVTNKFKRPSWFIEVQHYRPKVDQADNRFRHQRHFMRRALIRKFFAPFLNTLKKLGEFISLETFKSDLTLKEQSANFARKIFSPKSWKNLIRNKIRILGNTLKKIKRYFWGSNAYRETRRSLDKEYFSYIKKEDLLPSESIRATGFFNKRVKDFGVYYMFKTFGEEFRPLFGKYDIIQAYHWDPALVLMSGIEKPVVAFEHSTLRRTPLEDNMLGRLMGVAYHRAKKIIITNTDTVSTAHKIGLTNYTFIPHPLDTEKFKKEETPLRKQLLDKWHVDLILFSPTRQNRAWKGNDKFYLGFMDFIAKTDKKVKLILCSWGEEKEWAKQFLKDNGVDQYIEWLPILPKMTLKDYYNASDIIIDQFSEGVMGTIVPESMACEKPVIMYYNQEINEWAFPEKPPVVDANSPEEIAKALHRLVDNPSLRTVLGVQGRAWVEKYHSWEVTTRKHIQIYEEIIGSKILS